jgi:endonuclease/exonuclease/phosphatase (EEP) superfamily protein YafD
MATGWDSYAPARPFQALWVSLGVLALLPGLAATCLRLLQPYDDAAALLASFVSYGVVAYLIALVFFLVALLRSRRHFALGVVSAVTLSLLACQLSWLAPLFIADHRPATTAGFTVMSLNLRYGEADTAQVRQEAEQADVVVLLEATDQAVARLGRYGWRQRYPYAVGHAGEFAGGTMMFSRFPLSQPSRLPQSRFQQWAATAAVPTLGPVRIIAAHPCNPYCGGGQFRTEHQALRVAVDADLGRPLVVAGDLNAVDDHAPMLALRRDGMESVTDILGAGWLPTYPANSRIPPLLPIDHILLNHFLTATSLSRFHVDGTDHLGLIARIAAAA